MSIYSRIKSESPVEPIKKDETPFYMSNTNKGSECLIFGESEILHDEGGHSFTFYPKGVLLTLKESCKFYPNSKSYIFFNNNGEKVFEMYNSIKVRNNETHSTEFLPPEKDINVTIYEGFILVEETDLKSGEKTEYFVSIRTGEKIIDAGNNNNVDNVGI